MGHLIPQFQRLMGLTVASRTIKRFLTKQAGMSFVPVLHSLDGRFAFQG